MIEDALIAAIGRLGSRSEHMTVPTTPKEPELPTGLYAFGFAYGVLMFVISLIFAIASAAMAYRCNNKSVISAILALLFPKLYIIIHAIQGFQCYN